MICVLSTCMKKGIEVALETWFGFSLNRPKVPRIDSEPLDL
jgi:hypothetical protein